MDLGYCGQMNSSFVSAEGILVRGVSTGARGGGGGGGWRRSGMEVC